MVRRRVRAGTAALVAAVVLFTSGCVRPEVRWAAPRSGERPAAEASTTAVRWHPCPEVVQQVTGHRPRNATVECATVPVPPDWAAPGAGERIGISLLRSRAAGQRDRIGSLLVNPGGPGASGVDLAAYLAGTLPADITRRFDIVGFDPRGVGRSAPVKCFSDADLDATFAADPDPVDQAGFDRITAVAKRLALSCADKYGETLPLYSTAQAARDIDAVREAVGDAKTTYLGYSYGTLLGATYAQLFPTKVRALVLDGAVDPRQDLVSGSESQAKGFERALDNFAAWCRGHADQCPIGPDARAAVTAAIAQARTSPTGAGVRTATAGWVLTAVVSSLYSESGWLLLARALASLRKGDPTGVFRLADEYAERDEDGHYSNLFDANTVINCADEADPPSVAEVRELQARWRRQYPVFGASAALGMLNCAVWAGEHDRYPTGAAKGAPPIVVVGTTGDPATPYEQTAGLATMLGVGQVLTWQGEGHTAYPQTRCITQAVNQYLLELKVPAKNTVCPAR